MTESNLENLIQNFLDSIYVISHSKSSIDQIGKFKTVERFVNLNADNERFRGETLKNINDKVKNRSFQLNP